MALGLTLLSDWLRDFLYHSLLPWRKTINYDDVLTSEGRNEHVSIFDEVFNKPVGALQLYLMALQSLPELRTVQKRITELQRR